MVLRLKYSKVTTPALNYSLIPKHLLRNLKMLTKNVLALLDGNSALFHLVRSVTENLIDSFELVCDFFTVTAYLLAEEFWRQIRWNFQVYSWWRNRAHDSETQFGRFELETAFSFARKKH